MRWFGRGMLFGLGMLAGITVLSPDILQALSDRFAKVSMWLEDREAERDERLGKILARHLRSEA